MTAKYKIGVIGLPGKWSTDILADAVAERCGERHVFTMDDIWADIEAQKLYAGRTCLNDFDALIVKKISADYSPNTLDRLELLRLLEADGVRIYSPALHILRLINRLSCTVTLRQHAIPMPPTAVTEHIDQALDIISRFGSVVCKPLYSTKARGMTIVDSALPTAEQRAMMSAFQQQHQSMYMQKKLALPGHDLGMIFLAGEYVGTYARVGNTDSWNTTIHSGGSYAAFDASPELIDLGYRAQAPFGMDFTTVDIAESEHGPIVFEVSAFGGFRGAKEGLGIDIAPRYVDHVIKSLQGSS